MSQSPYHPELSQAGLPPTQAVDVVDEYQNIREQHIADERPLTIYIDRQEIVTLMTLGTQPELLTLGYLKNQNLITDIKTIKAVQVDWDVNASVVTTVTGELKLDNKLANRTVTTGCGQGTIEA